MIADIQHSFDVLNHLGVKAMDAQFILSKDGRAYLIDYEFFKQAESIDDARLINEPLREAFLAGIRANLKRQCGNLLDPKD